ncbi:NAD(P)/FAD-dependent oxidoreductase [Bradyrhizobium sp. CB82]|uniref:NAD(P)/FAD-dependent oxidoreductase n=1 Tax=Bradyrhizobium sp. CB82 TaxID=3039159 RepID=UPI0024B16981|nr:NAD(P)/FAD-dependent oxidoreductase [Bradyrhizobium sp. CB82]WFU39106.1 NAD(P)/FAD-dependent oxidoreductase [Bradyrhizobium sp. CB82]
MSSTGGARVSSAALPRVVIIGGGFGGLTAARTLKSAPVEVTLVDRRNCHLFQPLLYQVATAALSPGNIAWPLRSVFARQKNVRVVMMEVNSIDPTSKTVTDGVTTLPYDYLVVATGATHAYFGHPGWTPFAPGLKTIDDARALRERLLSACELAERSEDDEVRRRCLTTVVIGGGPTGVEMAGAVAELSHRTLKGEFRWIDPGKMRIVLVEAGPRLLPAFPERLSERCKRSLIEMGVEVKIGSSVTECTERGVSLGPERIDAATVVWAAGVRASRAAQWLDAEHDSSNRIIVRSDLSVPPHENIFAIGDTSAAQSGGRPVPGLAPAAKQMGRYVGRLIAGRVCNGVNSPAFSYKHQGDLAVIGRKSAVVAMGKLRLSGVVALMFWSLVHILFLIGFRSKIVVAFDWLWSFVTRQRSARLISDGAPGHAIGPQATRGAFVAKCEQQSRS